MLTIAWDVDDVLNELMMLWFKNEWLPKHAERIRYGDLNINPPHKILGLSRDGYLKSLDSIRLSPRYLNMAPVPEVKNWFKSHGDRYHHIAVTACSIRTVHASAEWVFRNFGRWVRTFSVIPSYRRGDNSPSYHRSKRQFLDWFGKADVFIDDNEENVTECRKIGIKAILFPRPWNSSKSTIKEALGAITRKTI